MNWDQLLSDKRFSRHADAPPKAGFKDPSRSPFEGDYDRLVYATPFRRLARKTQVHPLAAHDHVHNRLTHSIEVASVGRSFARRLGARLVEQQHIKPEQINDLCQIVQSACLAHDIGNPPFGHAGEFAMRQWVKDNQPFIFDASFGDICQGTRSDWACFEGNAQGFRIAARADNPRTGYLRLTLATLGAMIKYPWDSQDPRVATKAKFNIFSTEKKLFEQMTHELGMAKSDGTSARHPLSFLTEAADDICYRLLDLEDAVEMNILDESRVNQLFQEFLKDDGSPQAKRPLPVLRGRTIAKLIDACMTIYIQDETAIMAGQREDDLKSDLDSHTQDFLDKIKTLYDTIFAVRSKVAAELGAYETLGRIIRTLVLSVQQLSKQQLYGKIDFITQKRLELIWGQSYARENQSQSYEWWLHQVKDYAAGLTDNYAKQLSREMAGL